MSGVRLESRPGPVEEVEIVDHFRKNVWQGRDETNLACRGYRRATVTCDNCGNRFSYRYRVLGVGTSRGDADEKLSAYDERYRDAVNGASEDERRNFIRCPFCNKYQDWMKGSVAMHQRHLGRWIGRRALIASVMLLAVIGICAVVLTALWGLPWLSS